MDDIRIWVYVAFAAIYFFVKVFKKKKGAETQSEDYNQPKNEPKSVSFEDLLKEFTEGGKPAEVDPEPVYEATTIVEESRKAERPKVYEEGRTRRFSDDESRKIYEDSIKRAEGSDISFERAPAFKTNIEITDEEEEEGSIAEDIREMLSDSDQAKRAVILSEILNRKY